MYAGTTLTKLSGSVIGAHQKIDRIARKHLEKLYPGINFPNIRDILNFEGDKGPDGIKRKSPAKDEPWHFIEPNHPNDSSLIGDIIYHYDQLVKSLKDGNMVRSSFESSWLAHAIVDGLTPAHHYPYDKELSKLRNGESNQTRSSIKKKLIMPGETNKESIKNNWKMWGPKGLFTTHMAFEFGVAALIAPIRFNECIPEEKIINQVIEDNLSDWFIKTLKKVNRLNIYTEFYKSGWTVKLSNKIKNKLTPIIINSVTLVWIKAYLEANNK